MKPRFADDGIATFVARASRGRLDVAEMRAGVAARAKDRARGPELAQVYDLTAVDRPARVYRPDKVARAPLLVWLHGGGWTIGDVEAFDRVSRRLAAASGVSVLVLDYRLAPEHRWPAAVNDAVEAISWLGSAPAELGFVPSVVGVGGDSAGGTLAALATLRLARELPGVRPNLLALCYANTDLAGDYPSRAEKGFGFGLDVSDTEFFNEQWVADRSWWSAPGVSPLHSRDLGRLPPTIVVTAEHDHLRDEGTAFADRLEVEHVEVIRRCETGLIHNFLMLDEISPSAASAADRFAADIGALLRRTDATRSMPG
jgi:acetyl esterase